MIDNIAGWRSQGDGYVEATTVQEVAAVVVAVIVTIFVAHAMRPKRKRKRTIV